MKSLQQSINEAKGKVVKTTIDKLFAWYAEAKKWETEDAITTGWYKGDQAIDDQDENAIMADLWKNRSSKIDVKVTQSKGGMVNWELSFNYDGTEYVANAANEPFEKF